MEFKELWRRKCGKGDVVDIETEWNLKDTEAFFSCCQENVDIETEWNSKMSPNCSQTARTE